MTTRFDPDTADDCLRRLEADVIEMTTEREALAAEFAYECECCGAGAQDLYGINTNKDALLLVCQICGHAEICDNV